jgi:hypothetical protein
MWSISLKKKKAGNQFFPELLVFTTVILSAVGLHA